MKYYEVAYRYKGETYYREVGYRYSSPKTARSKARKLFEDRYIGSVVVSEVNDGCIWHEIARYER